MCFLCLYSLVQSISWHHWIRAAKSSEYEGTRQLQAIHGIQFKKAGIYKESPYLH